MNDFSNGLDAAELERLALLAEEAGELIQAINKTIRHGYDSHNPDKPSDGTNREQICRELGDLSFSIELMVRSYDLDEGMIELYRVIAKRKKLKYLHHQGDAVDG